MKKILVCGGIGSGKTTVTAMFKEKGFPVFNVDKCVSTCYTSEVINEIETLINKKITKYKYF